ncbi:MAG TPA: PIG-L deacetylase family protein [Chloroflexota bacterium]
MANRRILMVVPHPDDAELSCAASVARWVREGDTAILVVATDGARGGKYQGAVQDTVVETRRAEQRQAAAVVGFEEVRFLGFPDGELDDGPDLRGALVEQIRQLRPDVALILDPLTVIYRNSYVNHRDHRMLGMAMLDALYPEASNAGFFPEQLERGLEIHKVPELLLANSAEPNYAVDVTETLEVRFDALRRHESQLRLWPGNGEAVIEQQRRLAAVLGEEYGMRYAELFRRVVVNPLS